MKFKAIFESVRCTSACCKSTISTSRAETMDEASSFYVTLPSNACKDIYHNNTASNYKTRIVKPINLKYPYEVALVEIQYPHTWNTLDETCNDFLYTDGGGTFKKVCIPAGYYDSTKKLTDELNKAFIEAEKERIPNAAGQHLYNNIVFGFDAYSRRTKVFIKNDYRLRFNTVLAQALGFPAPSPVYTEPGTVSPRVSDVQRGFYSLYVYCDLCQPQIVGDSYVPLLRIVEAKGKDKQIITKTYAQPHYVPVFSKSFDTIEINIKDDTGSDVSFTSGKVICKLHFRIKR